MNNFAKTRLALLELKPNYNPNDLNVVAQVFAYFYPITNESNLIPSGFFPQLLDHQTKFYLESRSNSEIYQVICKNQSFFPTKFKIKF